MRGVISGIIAGAMVRNFTPITTGVRTASKIMIQAPEIVNAADNIRRILDIMRGQSAALRALQVSLANAGDWAGDDYEIHAERHRQLCNDIQELEECIQSCEQFLRVSADEFKQAQAFSKAKAGALKSPRGR